MWNETACILGIRGIHENSNNSANSKSKLKTLYGYSGAQMGSFGQTSLK
jgi:hypothetical protein